MVRHPFHADDHAHLIGPREAFDPERPENSSLYAVQNHLALEVAAHLAADDVPFLFQGGTPLHVKLGDRARFSIDDDLRTTDPAAVAKSLQTFAKRFQRSGIVLDEPPAALKIDGVRHTLRFPLAEDKTMPGPLRILVEVVEADDLGKETEPLPIRADGFDWKTSVTSPTFEGFVAQKFAVLGPTTIGKPVGRNETHARSNQGVCKQIYDLGRLLPRSLAGDRILDAYQAEVALANRMRGTEFSINDVVDDAAALLEHLREPKPDGYEPVEAYGLWSGYEDSRRWVRDRAHWGTNDYRLAGGLLRRVTKELQDGRLRWDVVGRPLKHDRVPVDVADRLSASIPGADWLASDEFAGDLRVTWAWAPAELW